MYVKERILFTRLLCSNDFNKLALFLTSAKKLCIIDYLTSNRMVVCWNTDFYSSYVISLNKTISNYFVNGLLPRLFANAKVAPSSLSHWVNQGCVRLVNPHLDFQNLNPDPPIERTLNTNYVLISFMTANMYQIWLHLSYRKVNLKVCWTLHERE